VTGLNGSKFWAVNFRFKADSLIFAALRNGAVSAVAEKGLKGAVAQSVEQRTENPCVGGSIPPHTTKDLLQK
jgi:hypothetical protein